MRDALDAIRATPFLHDTTTKNVIVTHDGVVSGIVDVDDLCFGDLKWTPFSGPLAKVFGVVLYRNGWSDRDDEITQEV
jgi:hypothetical protein